MSSDLEELTKLPTENILYDMNFQNSMGTGETIATIVSSTSTNRSRIPGSANVTLGSAIFSGNTSQIRISEGTLNEQYLIEITITTSSGNTRIGRGLLRIE
jgi:hypothetical protein